MKTEKLKMSYNVVFAPLHCQYVLVSNAFEWQTMECIFIPVASVHLHKPLGVCKYQENTMSNRILRGIPEETHNYFMP